MDTSYKNLFFTRKNKVFSGDWGIRSNRVIKRIAWALLGHCLDIAWTTPLETFLYMFSGQWTTQDTSALLLFSSYSLKALNSIYRLRAGRLKNFISTQVGLRAFYSLGQIILLINDVITKRQLLDKENNVIVKFDQELSSIFGTNYIHITELKFLVRQHLCLSVRNSVLCETLKVTKNDINKHLVLRVPDLLAAPPPLQNFSVNRKLFYLLSQVDTSIRKKTIFYYSEIIDIILKYIKLNAEKLLPLGSEIISCRETCLGDIFNINLLHRIQLDEIIRPLLNSSHFGVCMTINTQCITHRHYKPPHPITPPWEGNQ